MTTAPSSIASWLASRRPDAARVGRRARRTGRDARADRRDGDAARAIDSGRGGGRIRAERRRPCRCGRGRHRRAGAASSRPWKSSPIPRSRRRTCVYAASAPSATSARSSPRSACSSTGRSAHLVFAVGELFDLDRIEILRGPQNALHGKSTTAGLVAIYTEPPVRELAGDASRQRRQRRGRTRRASHALQRPFLRAIERTAPSASLGVSALDEEANVDERPRGAAAKTRTTHNRLGVRGQLLWNVTDALDAALDPGDDA